MIQSIKIQIYSHLYNKYGMLTEYGTTENIASEKKSLCRMEMFFDKD